MKKNCLIILPRHIFPIVGGYAIKTINVVQILSEQYRTKVVVISETPITSQEREFYMQNCIEYYYYNVPKWRFYLNALIGLFQKKPIQCGYYDFGAVRKEVKRMSKDVDIVVATIIRVVPYLDLVNPGVKKVIDMVDSISLNYQRSAEKTTSQFWKLIYSVESKRLLKYEARSVEKANLTWYVNNDEAQHWSTIGKTLWTPMSVKEFLIDYNHTDPMYHDSVAFFGKMDYQPNIDAILWYYNNVHTKIENAPNLIVVGANPTKQISEIAHNDKTVTVTGFLEDPYLILKSVKAVVSPMQTGGGMQNKVLETMALAQVNILSPLAASPIKDAQNGVHFLVANTTEDYQTFLQKLDDKEFATKIAKQAREFIGTRYRYEVYKKILIKSIEEI